jgi:hypothetical protein
MALMRRHCHDGEEEAVAILRFIVMHFAEILEVTSGGCAGEMESLWKGDDSDIWRLFLLKVSRRVLMSVCVCIGA